MKFSGRSHLFEDILLKKLRINRRLRTNVCFLPCCFIYFDVPVCDCFLYIITIFIKLWLYLVNQWYMGYWLNLCFITESIMLFLIYYYAFLCNIFFIVCIFEVTVNLDKTDILHVCFGICLRLLFVYAFLS